MSADFSNIIKEEYLFGLRVGGRCWFYCYIHTVLCIINGNRFIGSICHDTPIVVSARGY